jgi:hypothetical protein
LASSGFEPAHQIEPVPAPEAEVDNRNVRFGGGDFLEGLSQISRFPAGFEVRFDREPTGQAVARRRVIVYD